MNTDNTMHGSRRFGAIGRRSATLATATGLVFGGFAGAFVVGHAAATPSSSAATSPGSAAPAAGSTIPANTTLVPNENATHEAGESAAREAQENAGQMPTVP